MAKGGFVGALQRHSPYPIIRSGADEPFWMFWYASTLLCVFTFLIHTRTFFPTPPAPPIPPVRLSLARGPRQHHYLPFTPSLLPPCEFSANPRRPAGSLYVFLPLAPVSCSVVHKDGVHVAVKVAFCLQDCTGKCCQVSLNPPSQQQLGAERRSFPVFGASQTQECQDRLLVN